MLIQIILPLLLTIWQGDKISHTDSEWRERLGKQRYEVMRQGGTETAYLGDYVFTAQSGVYNCAACKLPLFDSKDKSFLGCGWPTFTKPIAKKNVYYEEDQSLGFKRYEVLCRRCDSHLGHVFNDEGLRYCINSCCLLLDINP